MPGEVSKFADVIRISHGIPARMILQANASIGSRCKEEINHLSPGKECHQGISLLMAPAESATITTTER
jgi:hypothetical protein